MIEGIRDSINKDNIKALMSTGDAWRMAFNDGTGASNTQRAVLKIGGLGRQRAKPEEQRCSISQDVAAPACVAPKLARSGYQRTRMDSQDGNHHKTIS